MTKELVTKCNVAYKIWDAEEANIKHWLIQICDKTYICIVKELCEEIKKNFTQKNNYWSLYEVNIRLIQVRQGKDNVVVYACRLKAI